MILFSRINTNCLLRVRERVITVIVMTIMIITVFMCAQSLYAHD
jgi:hypothetical protein